MVHIICYVYILLSMFISSIIRIWKQNVKTWYTTGTKIRKHRMLSLQIANLLEYYRRSFVLFLFLRIVAISISLFFPQYLVCIIHFTHIIYLVLFTLPPIYHHLQVYLFVLYTISQMIYSPFKWQIEEK